VVRMPDGGYPLHLVTPFVDSSYVLYLRGADVHLKERFFPSPESKKMQLVSHGALSEPQVNALLFHLREWGVGMSPDEIRRLSYRGQPVRPQFRTSFCWYDY
jgi:hypothetical protein